MKNVQIENLIPELTIKEIEVSKHRAVIFQYIKESNNWGSRILNLFVDYLALLKYYYIHL